MGVTVETVSGVTFFKVRGALKLGEAVLDELRGRCCGLEARGIDRLVLDLEQVPAIDSSGIGVLLQAYTSLRNRGGHCKLLNPARAPLEVLRVVGLLTVFEVYNDRNSVLASFEPPPQQTEAGPAGDPERAA
ncbi:MAG TPA: STAS domain-containing protein [Terriglobales bacterium]|jgi:anti-sigma B factor antagonist|nr:STAS domain-containing protein [Terriglobales bacterium]